MNEGLMFKTYRNPTNSAGRRGSCCGKLTHSQILDIDAMAEEIARLHHIDVADAQHYCNVIRSYVTKALCAGKKLDFGDFSLSLTIKGSFPAANSVYDPARNSLALVATAGAKFKRRLAALRPENAGAANHPAIRGVLCPAVTPRRERALRLGSTVFVSGDCLLVDPMRGDEGVWLADAATGAMLAKGDVSKSTRTTLDCVFGADAGLAPGEYSLVICTRCGDAEASAPSRMSLRVELVP